MPIVPGQSGPRPAWYRRLPPALRRVAAASDRVPTLPLNAGASLRALVARLPSTLATGRPGPVQVVAQELADGICRALSRPRVTVWMLTAKRGQVVAYRTFLRTLLHELCHHLDYDLLRLRDSLHTQGFYQRESSLFHALDAGRVDAPSIEG